MAVIATPHPEILASEFAPPVLVGRSTELARAGRELGEPWPDRAPPWSLTIVGPPGSGTSALARAAARRLVESIRRSRRGGPPLLATVRVRWCRGAQGVAATLLQHVDEGFHQQGFAVAEIIAGLLRRLARDDRPAVFVFDDIAPSAPDLSPIWRALARPDRFLPEGAPDAPPVWVLLAGSP